MSRHEATGYRKREKPRLKWMSGSSRRRLPARWNTRLPRSRAHRLACSMRSFGRAGDGVVGCHAREVVLDDPVDLAQERGRGEVSILLDDAQVDPGSDRRPEIHQVVAREPPVLGGAEPVHRRGVDRHEVVQSLPRLVDPHLVPGPPRADDRPAVVLAQGAPRLLRRAREVDRPQLPMLDHGTAPAKRVEGRREKRVAAHKGGHDPVFAQRGRKGRDGALHKGVVACSGLGRARAAPRAA